MRGSLGECKRRRRRRRKTDTDRDSSKAAGKVPKTEQDGSEAERQARLGHGRGEEVRAF